MSELKPCPFCGGAMVAATWVSNDTDSLQAMEAPICVCGAQGPMYPTRAEAIAAWNRRATPTPPDYATLVATVAKAMNGETFAQTVDRIICEHSAWIGCPNKKVAEQVAFAALVRASAITERADSEGVTVLLAEREAAAVERCAKVAEAQAEANAKARVDRADDELAFEFRGLGRVIAAAIRQTATKGEGHAD